MRRPSPSLVVSIVAMVFAMAGSAIAAVDFARNAGAVDGKSATGAGSSTSRAAGKLVATSTSGALKGKIPARFLDLSGVVSGSTQLPGAGIEVTDNAAAAAVPIGGRAGLGVVTATCNDQNNKAGVEDPQATITFTNGAGETVNFVRSVGNGDAAVTTVAAGATVSFTINNSNTFRIYAQLGSLNYVIEGVERQDGANTATARCVIYGYGLAL